MTAKEMWEELVRRIEARREEHYKDAKTCRDAHAYEQETAHSTLAAELSQVLVMMNQIEALQRIRAGDRRRKA